MKTIQFIVRYICAFILWICRKQPQVDKNQLFIDVLKEYIDKYIVENDLTEDTAGHYDVFYRNISLFLAAAKLRDIEIDQVRIKHMEALRLWLRTNLKTCSITRASRHLELCKRVTKYAVSEEYMLNDPLTPIEGRRDKPKPVVFLEQFEIRKWMKWLFANDYLQLAADLFIFQCGTGVSYKDIYDHEVIERNGHTIILGSRKAEARYEARMFNEAKAILKKYNGVLPVLPNQTYNRLLKEVALILEIKKHLTSHVARKTHATLLAEYGVNTKSISLVLGNTERVVEKHYVGRNHKIVENEFDRVGLGDQLIEDEVKISPLSIA